MGENDRRVAVLRNLRQSAFDLADERFYILRSDKGANFEQKASSSPQR